MEPKHAEHRQRANTIQHIDVLCVDFCLIRGVWGANGSVRQFFHADSVPQRGFAKKMGFCCIYTLVLFKPC
ncbi:hypothetical protein SDC9_161336 [bioreactor metagenome]|uniref:Uncharacterized protein n=1 Tax=bioreactor metagenome TaxID=1076179 RepID=A0A645FJ59_9ZZZZ